jgi:predicted aconitase with swiveling domain
MRTMARTFQGSVLVAGSARGEALVSDEPLSFWGGYDPASGTITDRRHPLSGQCASGKILAIPFTKGSSTTTAILLESIRAGMAPAAILCRRKDTFLGLASVVAEEMYQRPIPVIEISPEDFSKLRTGQLLAIQENGMIEIESDQG